MKVDMGDYTEEARKIVEKSYSIVRQFVPGDSPEDRILKRVIIATGDPEFRNLILFKNNPVRAGIEAIKRGSTIFTDVEMVKAGINKRRLRSEVECVLKYADNNTVLTRTSSGLLNVSDRLNDSIVVIGNAPSAALALCEIIRGDVKPALVIATPVGFVNAAESKEEIRKLDVPSITSVGTRGGSTVAVAITNAIIELGNHETY